MIPMFDFEANEEVYEFCGKLLAIIVNSGFLPQQEAIARINEVWSDSSMIDWNPPPKEYWEANMEVWALTVTNTNANKTIIRRMLEKQDTVYPAYIKQDKSPGSVFNQGNENFIITYVNTISNPTRKQESERLLTDYLNVLWSDLYLVTMRWFDDVSDDKSLPTVYTWSEVEELEITNNSKSSMRHPALKVVHDNKHLVIVGRPGVGKTTLVSFIALCMVGASSNNKKANLKVLEDKSKDPSLVEGYDPFGRPVLTQTDQLAWNDKIYYPVFIKLSSLVESDAFQKRKKDSIGVELLFEYLADSPKAGKDFSEALRNMMGYESGEGIMVILDGLDEIPNLEENKRLVRDFIMRLMVAYDKSRILVTTRPNIIQNEDLSLKLEKEPVSTVQISKLNERQILNFINTWYRAFVDNTSEADNLANELFKKIKLDTSLSELAETPLFLEMMCVMYRTDRMLGVFGRSDLYNRIVDLLIHKWNNPQGAETITKQLDISVSVLRSKLEKLAFDMQVKFSKGHVADANVEEIEAAFRWSSTRADEISSTSKIRSILEYLKIRSGILINDEGNLYSFPHSSIREFLVACFIENNALIGDIGSNHLSNAPESWRDVCLFYASQIQRKPHSLIELVDAIYPADLKYDKSITQRRAIIAADIWTSFRDKFPSGEENRLERLSQALKDVLETDTLQGDWRRDAGVYLNLLGGGDTREGTL